MREWFTALLMAVSLPAMGDDQPTPPTAQQRQEAFESINAITLEGDPQATLVALFALIDDEAQPAFHAEAYARAGASLQQMGYSYSALLSNQRALQIDAAALASVVKPTLEQSLAVGDIEPLQTILAQNVALEVDDVTRGALAYHAALSAHRNGEYATASAVLRMVSERHDLYPDAMALQGVVTSLQGRHEDALRSLLIAQSLSIAQDRDPQTISATNLNIARAYYTIENFPRAIEYYVKINRESPYWPQAQFERAWAHFRLQDMNGTLALLHTHDSPFFTDWHFPEASMLRIYALFLMCKFPEASDEIEAFETRYAAQLNELRELATLSAPEVYAHARGHISGQDTPLPTGITRWLENEDRFLDNLQAVEFAEEELGAIQWATLDPQLSENITAWLNERRDEIISREGERIATRIQSMADELSVMLTDAEINKLDILQMETRLYEQASRIGAMPDARETVRRDVRVDRGQLYWPWQGEYWADEVGHYRINTRPDCPTEMTESTQ